MNYDFVKRTALAWGLSEEIVYELFQTEYKKSVRLNKFKVKKNTLPNIKRQLQYVESIKWSKDCYLVEGEINPSQLEEFSRGEYIIQNAASFIPVLELDPKPGEYILDMAAAPGGKSSHIANLSLNKARLVLNDTSRTRFFSMKKLMEQQGVNAEYTLRDGRSLVKYFGKDIFDKILLDAPCSGEANMKPGDNWNISTIKRLSKLQARLLSEAVQLLKPGGRLVYSTCTIAPEENEGVIDNVLRHNIEAEVLPISTYPVNQTKPVLNWGDKKYDESIKHCLRLLPSATCKPFFVAIITKSSESNIDNSYKLLQKNLTKDM